MKTTKALLIGHLWVTIPSVLIALISFVLPLYIILENKLSPGWIFPSLIIPLGFGILTYSFFVVKWKIWAKKRVGPKFFYDYLILVLKDSSEIEICIDKLNVSPSDLDYQILYFSGR